jgi:hypothetical protein
VPRFKHKHIYHSHIMDSSISSKNKYHGQLQTRTLDAIAKRTYHIRCYMSMYIRQLLDVKIFHTYHGSELYCKGKLFKKIVEITS